MGAFTAFLVALFTEMYGIPLTIYLLGSWLGSQFPLLRTTHAGGHLWNDLIGWTGDPHLSPFHLASYVAIGGGFWLIAVAWRHLHDAAREGRLATTGPYAWVRHPLYTAVALLVLPWIGFLLGTWLGVLIGGALYGGSRIFAPEEEASLSRTFGDAWRDYSASVRLRWL